MLLLLLLPLISGLNILFNVIIPVLVIAFVLGLLGIGVFGSLLVPIAIALGVALLLIVAAAVVIIILVSKKKKKAKAALVADEVALEEIPEETAVEVEVSAEVTVEE